MSTPISYLSEKRLLTVDFAMLLLLLINLSWMAFDWLFANPGFQGFLQINFPAFHEWYLHAIHYNFLAIDLVFIVIFLTEFLVRWGWLSAVKNTSIGMLTPYCIGTIYWGLYRRASLGC